MQHIRYEVVNGVAHVILARPDKLNALGFGPESNRAEIAEALVLADEDPGVGAILLRAEGRMFCAGGDLAGLPSEPTVAQEQRLLNDIDRFHTAVRETGKPLVAAVHNCCLGAGLALIAQCDFVLASEDARFGLPEGRYGHPGGVELTSIIGAAWAKFLIFTGELLDADRARLLGLVLEVLPGPQLNTLAIELCERIARMPRDGLRLNKAAIRNAEEASGRHAGRLAGRAGDVATKAASRFAAAPDGSLFDEIRLANGVRGLKEAQRQQYETSWLALLDPHREVGK